MSSESPKPNNLEGNYQIKISQDGKFAATFDTANLCIKILKNTDYRPFKLKRDKDLKKDRDSSRVHSGSEINETIAHFKIDENFTIKEFHDKVTETLTTSGASGANNNGFKWSFDISNVQKRNYSDEYFILVAVSRINVKEDMKGTKKRDKYYRENLNKKPDYKQIGHGIDIVIEDPALKGTAIYYLELEKNTLTMGKTVDCYYSHKVSGICKFVDTSESKKSISSFLSENNDVEQKRFIILNFHGIYNFELNDTNYGNFISQKKYCISFDLNKEFKYPKSIRRELDNWYANTDEDDCMKRLHSCIYDKYFLATQYKDNVQALEVYNLAKMELETIAKRIENKDDFLKRYDTYQTFSVSNLQFCFTRGTDQIVLYFMENGLQVASKGFDKIEKIYSLEFFDNDEKLLIVAAEGQDNNPKFVIWDLYHTGETKEIMLKDLYECTTKDFDAHLARTSGNILHVDDDGNVTSVLKEIENKSKESNESKPADREARKAKCIECDNDGNELNNCKCNIYYDESDKDKILGDKEYMILNFNRIADKIEPWVLGSYEKKSYCLYYDKRGTETEFLQLIVGRSTVQIWHQIQDDNKNKDDLPNKGDPFLEYIWTNGIPVNQEREETRLRVKFEYGSTDISQCECNQIKEQILFIMIGVIKIMAQHSHWI